MSRRLLASLLAALPVLAVSVGHPGVARAWTEAAVRSARAHVRVDGGEAFVRLEVEVRVARGWLEGLEIAGLGPDLILADEVPPWAVDADGGTYAPRLQVRRGGRVLVAFPGRSPRRGRVALGFGYRVRLPPASRPGQPDRHRVAWTLPGWRSGLDGVEVVLDLPEGSRFVAGSALADPSLPTAVERRRWTEGGRTYLAWRRAHLPRTVPWTVEADVPAPRGETADGADPAPAAASALASRPERAPVGAATPPVALALVAFVLAVLLSLKELSAGWAAAAAGAAPRPWVPGGYATRTAVAAVALVAGVVLGAHDPRWAIALFGLAMWTGAFRPSAGSGESWLGAWHPVTADDRRAARRDRARARLDPLDGSQPAGLVTLAAVSSAPVWLPALGAPVPFDPWAAWALSLLPLPLFLTGTRAALPPSPAEAMRSLIRLARGHRPLPAGLRLHLALYRDVRDRVEAVRMRVWMDDRPDGLLRFDIGLGTVPALGSLRRTPVLLLVTRARSEAEARLAQAFPAVVARAAGRRVLRAIPLGEQPLGPLLARTVAAFDGSEPLPSATGRRPGLASARA
ncbi:MAG: hypothetical protein ACFCGT_03640 [Sandaracinaceae bacterium]